MLPTIHTNINFLVSRIYEIKSALFTNNGEGEFKQPTCIISVLKVTEKGNLWFLMNRHGYDHSCYGAKFPANLSFHRKGICFSMVILGIASFVFDSHEIEEVTGVSTADQFELMKNVVLVKVDMVKINYLEWKVKAPRENMFKKYISRFLSLFYLNTANQVQGEFLLAD